MTANDAYAYRRVQMVEALGRHGIEDPRVLDAMRRVPRDLFVPEAYRNAAYSEDVSINIGEGQTISQPRVVASMTQAARIEPDDRVLEIGTGSGYQAAVLAHLARFVFSIERIASLARQAKATLDRLGLENVSVKVMDGTLGWRSFAPFDAILVTAAAPEIPEPLVDQLADGGRLVVPVGTRETQVIRVVRKRGERTTVSELQGACFVPLIGRHGWAGEDS
ncbi:MAG: protein-L-isoaspartate(D-aspartate) O-methyltransferase [Candidatus Sulfomarinibacteraceae bacterium]